MWKWLEDSTGVTSTEYAVMLALLLGVCTTSINCLGGVSYMTFQRAGESMSGAAPQDPASAPTSP